MTDAQWVWAVSFTAGPVVGLMGEVMRTKVKTVKRKAGAVLKEAEARRRQRLQREEWAKRDADELCAISKIVAGLSISADSTLHGVQLLAAALRTARADLRESEEARAKLAHAHAETLTQHAAEIAALAKIRDQLADELQPYLPTVNTFDLGEMVTTALEVCAALRTQLGKLGADAMARSVPIGAVAYVMQKLGLWT